MTMTIKINTIYTTRDGNTFRALEITSAKGTYAVRGEDSQGRITWRSLKGRFARGAHALDLVAIAA
jgi:hypothetical protein